MMAAPAFRTAERRARGARSRLPRLRTVLVEQVRATGFALRGAALIGGTLLALVTIAGALQRVSMGAVVNLYQWPSLLPGVVGALLPIAVWARDERFGPGFLWTLPVDRRRLALTKVVAGWVWLMGGVAVAAFGLLFGTFAAGGSMLPPETLQLLPSPVAAAGPLDLATLRSAPWAPSPLIWAVPFTAATATYLLASAFVLGSRQPLRWMIGTVLFYAMLSVTTEAADTKLRVGWLGDAPDSVMQMLVEGRYGLDALLTARTGTLSTTTTLMSGQRVMVWRAVPHLADWGIATLLWTSAGALALSAAVSRHRERRRA